MNIDHEVSEDQVAYCLLDTKFDVKVSGFELQVKSHCSVVGWLKQLSSCCPFVYCC